MRRLKNDSRASAKTGEFSCYFCIYYNAKETRKVEKLQCDQNKTNIRTLNFRFKQTIMLKAN